MNKKADKKYIVIVGMVLLVAVVLIMGLFIKSWAGIADFFVEKNKCKQSVLAASIDIKGVQFSQQIDCPTTYTTIKETDSEKIKMQIAKSLAYHWDNFGQGKIKVFSKETVYCVVNEVFEFEEKNKEITGMTKYLFENNVPGTNIRYVDFIAGKISQKTEYLTQEDVKKIFEDNFDKQTINTNNKYAIVFSQAIGKSAISNLKDIGGTAKTSVFAGVVGIGVGGAVVGGVCLVVTGGLCVVPMLIGGAALGTYTSIATFLSGEEPDFVSIIRLIEYDEHSLGALGCKYLPVEQQTFKK